MSAKRERTEESEGVIKQIRVSNSSDSGSGSDSGSHSSSHSHSDSDSHSSSESDTPARPKFVRRRNAPKVAAPEQTERVNWNVNVASTPTLVDDTDGPDAAAQYAAWRQREQARLQRELDALEAQERAYEEMQDRLERNAIEQP